MHLVFNDATKSQARQSYDNDSLSVRATLEEQLCEHGGVLTVM